MNENTDFKTLPRIPGKIPDTEQIERAFHLLYNLTLDEELFHCTVEEQERSSVHAALNALRWVSGRDYNDHFARLLTSVEDDTANAIAENTR